MLSASGLRLLVAARNPKFTRNTTIARSLSCVRRSFATRLPYRPHGYTHRHLSTKHHESTIREPLQPKQVITMDGGEASSKAAEESPQTNDSDLDAILEQLENRRRPATKGARLDGLFQASERSGSLQQPQEHELPQIRHNYYAPSDITANRSVDEVNDFRRKHQIRTSADAPAPIFTLDELANMPAKLIEGLRAGNIEECTPIQAQGIPIALSGRNVIGMAETGSGKTLAYIIPALMHIVNQAPLERKGGPIALVLVPTRELARQIHLVATKLGSPLGIRSTVLYGGTKDSSQCSDLEAGCELIIATPGRLIDLMNSAHVTLQHCSYLVLDEADLMLNIGLHKQTRRIVSTARADCQMLLWSATMPPDIKQLANDFFRRQHFCELAVGGSPLAANPNIQQNVYVCDEFEKDEIVSHILNGILSLGVDRRKTLIFVKTAASARHMVEKLTKLGITADAIYGGRYQHEREQVLNAFNNDQLDMLVGTIVASRGLDLKDVGHVILYDFPKTCSEYINQIGRTARAGTHGTAYALFDRVIDRPNAPDLVAVLEASKRAVDDELVEIAKWVSGDQGNKSKKNRFKGY